MIKIKKLKLNDVWIIRSDVQPIKVYFGDEGARPSALRHGRIDKLSLLDRTDRAARP